MLHFLRYTFSREYREYPPGTMWANGVNKAQKTFAKFAYSHHTVLGEYSRCDFPTQPIVYGSEMLLIAHFAGLN
jgi:hypothetical protein